MKHLQKYLTVIIFILISMFSVSCVKENKLDHLQNSTHDVESFFESVIVGAKKSNLDSESAIYVTYQYQKSDNLITILNLREMELDFFLIESSNARLADYKVTCTVKGKDIWTKECDGKFSCGSLVYECLEGGGCGTVCQSRMIYHPATQNFYILN